MITLTTDYGYQDAYAATLKAILHTELPQEPVLDISHAIPAGNCLSAAYVVKTCYRYFPAETIHLVVVDPGVGTTRRPLLLKAAGPNLGCVQYFIGPDNGIFSYVMRDAVDFSCYLLDESRYPAASKTFHGRDVFLREAIRLRKEIDLFGLARIDNPVAILPAVTESGNEVSGTIIHIDRFGNLITNLESALGRFDRCTRINGETASIEFNDTYGSLKPDQPLLLLNSENHYEIAINCGNAAKQFRAGPGTPVTLVRSC